MAQKHRPGSEAAAVAKNEKLFNGGFSIVFIILILVTLFAKGTYFHHYFINAAFSLKLIGFILLPIWFSLVWFVLPDSDKMSGGMKGIIMFGGMALILLFLFGFNLSL